MNNIFESILCSSHTSEIVTLFCIEKACNCNHLLCSKCLISSPQLHHENNTKSIKILRKWIEDINLETQQFINNYNSQFESIKKQQEEILQRINQFYFVQLNNFTNLNYDQTSNLITTLLARSICYETFGQNVYLSQLQQQLQDFNNFLMNQRCYYQQLRQLITASRELKEKNNPLQQEQRNINIQIMKIQQENNILNQYYNQQKDVIDEQNNIIALLIEDIKQINCELQNNQGNNLQNTNQNQNDQIHSEDNLIQNPQNTIQKQLITIQSKDKKIRELQEFIKKHFPNMTYKDQDNKPPKNNNENCRSPSFQPIIPQQKQY